MAWIRDPQAIEPGTVRPNMGVTPRHARDIAAYPYTLGDPAEPGPPHLFPGAVAPPVGSREINVKKFDGRSTRMSAADRA